MPWPRLANGCVAGHVVRLEGSCEHGNSKPDKQIIPYFKDDGQPGIPVDLPNEYRIYGLDSISDYSKPVFIVEGEKCAYALQGLGFQAITSLGGSGQVAVGVGALGYTLYSIFTEKEEVQESGSATVPNGPTPLDEPFYDYYLTVPESVDLPLDTVEETVGVTVISSVEEPYVMEGVDDYDDYPQQDETINDEDRKKETIRQVMSELGKRSAAARRRKTRA